eukprot:s218_g36.t1
MLLMLSMASDLLPVFAAAFAPVGGVFASAGALVFAGGGGGPSLSRPAGAAFGAGGVEAVGPLSVEPAEAMLMILQPQTEDVFQMPLLDFLRGTIPYASLEWLHQRCPALLLRRLKQIGVTLPFLQHPATARLFLT